MRRIIAREPAWKRNIVRLAAKQGFINIHYKSWPKVAGTLKPEIQILYLPPSLPVTRSRAWLTIELLSPEERRDQAVWAMTVLGQQARRAIPELAQRLHDPSTSPYAIDALAGIGPEVIPVLATVAADGSVEVRQHANKALVMFAGRKQATAYSAQLAPVFLRNLRDEDCMVRGDAAIGLPFVANAATAIPPLVRNLQDTNTYVRAMAAAALGMFGSQSAAAVPSLLELAKSEDAFAREQATTALGRIAPPAAESGLPTQKQ